MTNEAAPDAAARPPRILPFGDAAVLVEFGNAVDRALSDRVLALDAALALDPIDAVTETAPSFRSLMVQFDPLVATPSEISAEIQARLSAIVGGSGGDEAPARIWSLPVCYEGDLAPDLQDVATRLALTPEEVVARHAATTHHVFMLGFLPGSPYLGGLDPALTLPRRTDPRVKVPARSVAIAIGLSVIYPVESPGGWHLIGRTPVELLDPTAQPPALLAPGDAIRFTPIPRAEFDALERAAAAGEWRPTPPSPSPSAVDRGLGA